jgi:hypothetical protein
LKKTAGVINGALHRVVASGNVAAHGQTMTYSALDNNLLF